MPKYEMEDRYQRCKKCHQPIFKLSAEDIKKYCLEGYNPDTKLCIGCNATNSLVAKMGRNEEITKEDCKRLPNTLRFDPKNDNSEESACAIRFMQILKEFEKSEKENAVAV